MLIINYTEKIDNDLLQFEMYLLSLSQNSLIVR